MSMGIWALAIITSVVGAFNPCTIGILLLIMTNTLGRDRRTKHAVLVGLAYAMTLYVTLFVLGWAAFHLLTLMPVRAASYVSIAISLAAIAAGILEIKEYFWHGHGVGLRLSRRDTAKIKSLAKGAPTPGAAIVIGLFTSLVALPCLGAAYAVAIAGLNQSGVSSTTIQPLLLCNLVFITPMLFVMLLVARGVKLSTIHRWKDDARGKIRLAVGLLLIILGWTLILMSNGVLNLR